MLPLRRRELRPRDVRRAAAPALRRRRVARLRRRRPLRSETTLAVIQHKRRQASARSTASESRGHASFAQSPNGRVVSAAQATPRSGSTQRNVPLPPKWPNVLGEVSVPDQCPSLRALELDAEPPVERAEAPEVGQHPVEPRELDAHHLLVGLRARRAAARAARGRARARPPASRACPRPDGRRVEPETERRDDRLPDVVRERHLRALRDVLAEHAEALVRVDAPPPGRRDRGHALERQPRRVGEQVPNGGPGRPGRLVEVDDALLGGDERRERRDRLRDRRQPYRPFRVAVGGDRGVRARHTGGREGDIPGVDLVESVHGARY